MTAIDVCRWAPLFATCGRDRAVRVWNYERRTVELVQKFSDEPLSLALHPSGFHVVVGFMDKLRYLNIITSGDGNGGATARLQVCVVTIS